VGREVGRLSFEPADFERFSAALARETDALQRMLGAGAFAEGPFVAGFELEAWLVDRAGDPAPLNESFLERLDDPLVVPELSRFNVELNGTPQPLGTGALRRLEAELDATWRRCLRVSHELEAGLVMTGILPTVRDADLTLANMSARRRYAALNEQVMAARHGRPLRVRIAREASLDTVHRDVMLEAATTSFQIHLQVPASRAVRFLNAATILSAPLVAAGANSPLLFATPLWEETRIPLFEQAVEPMAVERPRALHRVTLGTGYAQASLHEVFAENAREHPVLLPMPLDSPAERLAHVRLHNGTIWRWNRPIIGFDAHGRPHLRIEQRVLPAGPSIRDQIANMAFYFGAVCELARHGRAPEERLPFAAAQENFYAAARDGLGADLVWLDGTHADARSLLLDELLPLAGRGLERLGLDAAEIDDYLGIVRARVRLRQTGAAWQRACFESQGRDVHRLTAAYLEHQRSGMPVHEWD